MDYVIYNTVILHFCGKRNHGILTISIVWCLYKYYQKMVQMDEALKGRFIYGDIDADQYLA